jgi:hypothetical protein
MKYYQNELAKIDMVLIDEADQGGSKQYQNVITRLFNTRVRIGLSGTIYMSKLAKDKVKNMNLRCFFGDSGGMFKPQHHKARKALLKIAEKYKWTYQTTRDKILLNLKLGGEGVIQQTVQKMFR